MLMGKLCKIAELEFHDNHGFSMIFHLDYLQLIASGAFEISINDIPVWSKLETGRIPSPQELFNIIDSHLSINKVTVPNYEK